jgi:uncharacterized membrane protein
VTAILVVVGIVVVVVGLLAVAAIVQDARADAVSSSWRDQQFRDEGRRDG